MDKKFDIKTKNKKLAYEALVNYHNHLVSLRFTVLGLFIAANGFLANGFFQRVINRYSISIPVLGLMITILCLILETRNYQLLINVGCRGKRLELDLGIPTYSGFFSLMESQPKGPQTLVLGINLPFKNLTEKLLSHSVGIGLTYYCIGCFWLIMIILLRFFM